LEKDMLEGKSSLRRRRTNEPGAQRRMEITFVRRLPCKKS
jgi:hypothetical protein